MFVTTLEGVVCTSCAVVRKKIDEGSITKNTTFGQQYNYDEIKMSSTTDDSLNKYTYIITPILFSIPPFQLVDLSVQNSITSQCIQIISKMFNDEIIGRNSDPELLASASLIITLAKEGVTPIDVFKAVSRESKFEKSVTGLVKLFESRNPTVIFRDVKHTKLCERTLNSLELDFKKRGQITGLFQKSMDEVWFDGSHVRLVLATCILYSIEDNPVDFENILFFFKDEWGFTEVTLRNKIEILRERLKPLL